MALLLSNSLVLNVLMGKEGEMDKDDFRFRESILALLINACRIKPEGNSSSWLHDRGKFRVHHTTALLK